MNDERQILRTDLVILEEMVIELEPYLMSDTIRWPMTKQDRPELSIGGCLMRQHRLEVLRDRLPPEEQSRVDAAIKQFGLTLKERVIRFECRAHQELHVRLGEWTGFLRCLTKYKGTKIAKARIARYAGEVDTRVVVTALIDKLRNPPYELDRRILEQVTMLDRSLRNRWQEGDFVWAPVWQPAYPSDRYWWLYGKPDS
jgi:hypothetical protein